MTICKNFRVCQSLPYSGWWQCVSIDGEVVQKQRLDIKLPLLCRISPQCVHGGEQLVGTVQRAAAQGHGIGILLKHHAQNLFPAQIKDRSNSLGGGEGALLPYGLFTI